MKKKLILLLTGLMLFSGACNQSPVQTEDFSDVSTSTSDSSEIEDTSSSDNGIEGSENTSTENESAKSRQTASQATDNFEEPDPAEGLCLKDLFAAHDMKVGTCLSTQMIGRDVTNLKILEQFNSVTMENSMKPDAILNQKMSQEAGRLVVNFNNDAVQMLKWAKENNFSMRGHTLVWYSQTPEWLFHVDFDPKKEFVNREELLARMESMIKQVFEKLTQQGYIDQFYAYDVVNEAWMEDGSMRKNHWSDIIGDDYLWYAFYYADKYAPESIDLYYNDYNEQFKTSTLVDFVNTLVDENGNYLIDGIGLQAHLYTSDNLDDYFRTVDTLAQTGLKLQLTELDVCLGKYESPLPATEENLAAQGRFYYNLINGLLERVDSGKIKMDALTFWGFADNLSWRKEYSPLLYDAKLAPKKALYGALQLQEACGE